jgi:hypothetical protein
MADNSVHNVQYKRSASISEKLERTFVIQQELIDVLKRHGCPNCLQLLREIVKKYGRMSDSNQTFRTSTGETPIDILDITTR